MSAANPIEVERYLAGKGMVVRAHERIKGQDNLVLDCPLCGKEYDRRKGNRPLYIRIGDGTWVTNCCTQGGTFYMLRQQLGDVDPSAVRGFKSTLDDDLVSREVDRQLRYPEQPKALAKNPDVVGQWATALRTDADAWKYVTETRGFTVDTIDRFKLGLATQQGRRWLVIPYVAGGKVVMVKRRSIDGDKTFRRWPEGVDAPLYNVDALEGQNLRVYLTEGELDAESLDQMGYRPAVSLPNGAKDITDAHAAFLERFDEIYLVTDNDPKGEKAAAAIGKRFGVFRCYRVKLPLKDANACLAAGKVEEVRTAIQAARAMGGGLVSLAEAWLRAFTGPGQTDLLSAGYSTGMTDLDLVIGGIRPAELTVCSGDSGAGKSTVVGTLQANLARAKVSTLLLGFEMPLATNAIRLGGQVVGKSAFQMNDRERGDALHQLLDMPVTLVDRHGKADMTEVEGWVEYSVRRLGVEVVVIDHIDFLLRNLDDFEEMNRCIDRINEMVNRIKVHVILVVHPKSLDKDSKTGIQRKVTMGDLRNGTKIKQLAHNILIVDPADPKTGISVMRIEKRRWTGNTTILPARIPLKWDKLSGRYETAEFPAPPPPPPEGVRTRTRTGPPRVDTKALQAGEKPDED